MKFDNEDQLQAFIHSVVGGQREVRLGAGRIDIRTEEYDIEVKPVLTRPALDKAAGQLMRYAPYSGGRQQVIAGLVPDKADEELIRQAESLVTAGLEIWFIDRLPEFQQAYAEYTQAQPVEVEVYPPEHVTPTQAAIALQPLELPTQQKSLTGAALWLLLGVAVLILITGLDLPEKETPFRPQPAPLWIKQQL